MSNNIIHTVGQHVFKYDPPLYTETGAPVLAKNPVADPNKTKDIEPKLQFLGEGYYFWDDNIERAHKWGWDHYDGDYKIMELPLELKGDKFLDLVGSRADLQGFCRVFDKMREKKPGLKIGAFFKGMQEMEKNKPGSWTCTIVRALNAKNNAQKICFNHISTSKMLLNPEIIICFYEKKELNLQNLHYIDRKERT